MNNFHIYEEVGRGKDSVVYKVSMKVHLKQVYNLIYVQQGRKKKTVEYVAVKSVEKFRRRKVLNEVSKQTQPSFFRTDMSNLIINLFCVGSNLP